jgi:predicted CopG family antitoxin
MKTLTIKDEVYEKLLRLKRENEKLLRRVRKANLEGEN